MHFSLKTCLMHQIRADLICEQSHSFTHFAVRCLAYCLPLWPTWLFRELSTVSSRSSPASLTHLQGLQSSWSPSAFPPLFPSAPFLSNEHKHAHTHTKETRLTHTHPPNFSDLPCLCFPSTSHLSLLVTLLPPSSVTPTPPILPLPQSLSRPEATAGTCMAGCYVGAMTTVMNSTWRSRIQADVSLDAELQMALTYLKNETLGGFRVDFEGFFPL